MLNYTYILNFTHLLYNSLGGYGMVTKGICKRTGVEVAVKEMSKRETSAK